MAEVKRIGLWPWCSSWSCQKQVAKCERDSKVLMNKVTNSKYHQLTRWDNDVFFCINMDDSRVLVTWRKGWRDKATDANDQQSTQWYTREWRVGLVYNTAVCQRSDLWAWFSLGNPVTLVQYLSAVLSNRKIPIRQGQLVVQWRRRWQSARHATKGLERQGDFFQGSTINPLRQQDVKHQVAVKQTWQACNAAENAKVPDSSW